jgi:hypothetical protein
MAVWRWTYKKIAETAWRKALPLLRVGGEQIGRDREKLKYIVPDAFAGSILNLTPGTDYDVRLTLLIRTVHRARPPVR